MVTLTATGHGCRVSSVAWLYSSAMHPPRIARMCICSEPSNSPAANSVLRFRPAPGPHLYKAFRSRRRTPASSRRGDAHVTIQLDSLPRPVLLSSTGTWGHYSLTATVEGGERRLFPGASFKDTSNGNAVLGDGPRSAQHAGCTGLLSALPVRP